MAMSPDLRKRLFRSALALSGMTAKEFAGLQGISDQHLSMVLSEKRTSAPIIAAVDRFIDTVSKKHGGCACA